MTPVSKGILLRLLGGLLMTGMSACIRIVAQELPLGQIMFWRASVALIPIVIYMALCGDFPRALQTRRPGMHLKRAVFGSFTMVLSFTALAYLPVSSASALGYLSPIITLPVAALVLGEHLSRRLVLACLLGFGGVLAMLSGSFTGPEIDQGTLIGIGAGLGFAVTVSVTRVHIKEMTRTEFPAAIAFYFALFTSLIGALSYFLGWEALDRPLIAALLGAGFLGGMGHICGTEASARAPVSVLAPYDYTGMIWALAIDMLIFQLVPGAWSLIGVFAITCAGLMIALKRPMRTGTIAQR
jgi:drug/metabolite transporter (DMT)-like permease